VTAPFSADPFVDVAWVSAHLADPRVRIVDARSMPHGAALADAKTGAEQYAAGHIPGAVHLDYARELADARGAGRPLRAHARRVRHRRRDDDRRV
jgi:thiosulfate/3-mercaptopyruvate sulfurtransferase